MALTRDIIFERTDSSSLDTASLSKLLGLLDTVHKAVPLTRFQFQLITGDPGRYEYQFTAADGRDWRQRLRFDILGNPAMTFNEVVGEWRKSEFIAHRPVRDEIERLYDLGARKIDVKWTAT